MANNLSRRDTLTAVAGLATAGVIGTTMSAPAATAMNVDAELIRLGRELDEAIAEYERGISVFCKIEREFFAM